MNTHVVLAAAQFDPHLGDKTYNVSRIQQMVIEAVHENAQLIVFPECAITGYNFASLDDAREVAEPIDGPAIQALAQVGHDMKVHLVTGTLRSEGNQIFNSAVLISPQGIVGTYDKVHLPLCGADKFTTHGGRGFQVYDTALGRIGMMICYDLRFPEAARTLALRGADAIALPTNWPSGAETAPDFMVRARAFEDRVFIVASNRIGQERGTRFIGHSCIAAPDGQHLADASSASEEIIYASVKIADARQKRLVITPGEFEMDFFNDRRPDMYAC